MASHKPVFWALFAAGGTLSALLAPVLIFLIGFAVPLELIEPEALGFARLSSALATLPMALTMLVIIVLFLWHAAHRLRVTAHDLGWFPDSVAVVLFYGLAAGGSAASGWLLVRTILDQSM